MKKLLTLLILMGCAVQILAQKGHDITIKLTEKASKEPIMMATVQLNPLVPMPYRTRRVTQS